MATEPGALPFSDSRLLASVRSRARQSILGVVVVAVPCVAMVLLLDTAVARGPIAVWLGGLIVAAIVRWRIARRAAVALLVDDVDAARRFDRGFLVASMAAQTICGAGVWLALTVDDPVAPYVLTLLAYFYCVGAAANLAHDLRAFVFSAPLLMVQPFVYWLLQGWDGVPMAVGCAGMLALMLSSVRTSQGLFDEGLRIRFEKDRLLEEVADRNLQLAAALEELDRANRAKSFFMATASHDLRQPIIAAALVGESLRRMPLPVEAKDRLAEQGAMLRETQTMMRNLLDVARFEEGVVSPVFEAFPLAQVFDYARLAYLEESNQRGLALHVESSELWVRSDREMLQRLVGNLVSNALKYTEQGVVGVTARADGSAVCIAVSDTGSGIASADAQRMFEPFVRLTGNQGRKSSGAGLGLAIVRGIAGVLDGRLDVDSTLGAGTRVTVRLAQALASPRAVAAPTSTERLGFDDALAGQVVWLLGIDSERLRVLVSELSRLACVCGVAARVDECDALIADGERPDAVVFAAGTDATSSAEVITAWCANVVPQARVLQLRTPNDVAPSLESSGEPIADADRDALVRWLVEGSRAAAMAPLRASV